MAACGYLMPDCNNTEKEFQFNIVEKITLPTK